MAYELATGYMPFEASNTITLRSKIMKATFTNPRILAPDLSEKLQDVISKNIRANPSQRMSAREIENLLDGRKKNVFALPGTEQLKRLPGKFSGIQPKTWLYSGLFLLAFIIITMVFSKTVTVDPADKIKVDGPAGNDMELKINVPGITNAIIVFADGSQHSIPYEVKGKEGETISFTLHADGYADKKVLVDFSSHRSSYEYNLEKIKE